MTKEQKIIDGVDVLHCGHFSRFECETENVCYIHPIKVIGSDVNIGFGSCDKSPNCYYKQLKRKEQECEKIKNWVKGMMFYTDCSNWFERFITAFEDWKNDLTNQLDQLKTKNEELKETISDKEKWLSEIEIKNSEYWKEKYADLHIRYGNRIEELKQALQEIQELVKKDYCSEIESCEFCAEVGNCINRKILQKCEVLND